MSGSPSLPSFRLRSLLTVALIATLVIGLAPHPRARFWYHPALHARASGKRIEHAKRLSPIARKEREALFADNLSVLASGHSGLVIAWRGFDAGSNPRAPPLTFG